MKYARHKQNRHLHRLVFLSLLFWDFVRTHFALNILNSIIHCSANALSPHKRQIDKQKPNKQTISAHFSIFLQWNFIYDIIFHNQNAQTPKMNFHSHDRCTNRNACDAIHLDFSWMYRHFVVIKHFCHFKSREMELKECL